MDFRELLHSHSTLSQLRKNGELTDIDLALDTGKVAAHRVVLAAHSHFFRTRFGPGWSEPGPKRCTVALQHLKYETLNVVVDAIYTGRLEISKENAVDVLAAASELAIPSVVEASHQVCRPLTGDTLPPYNLPVCVPTLSSFDAA
jgi:hypothetical protein